MKILRTLICAALIILSLTPISAFALEEGKFVTEVTLCTGTLYLSDWEDEQVVLKDVTPVSDADNSAAVAAELEYTAVPAFNDNIRNGNDGSEMDFKSLAWFLDMKVQVTAARLADGSLRIIQIVTK